MMHTSKNIKTFFSFQKRKKKDTVIFHVYQRAEKGVKKPLVKRNHTYRNQWSLIDHEHPLKLICAFN